MVKQQICSNCVMLSCQYGPTSLRNVSNTLLNLCHEELRQFLRQNGVQPSSSKVYLIKWPVSVCNLRFFLSLSILKTVMLPKNLYFCGNHYAGPYQLSKPPPKNTPDADSRIRARDRSLLMFAAEWKWSNGQLLLEGALTSAPRGSGPTLAEAERHLKLRGGSDRKIGDGHVLFSIFPCQIQCSIGGFGSTFRNGFFPPRERAWCSCHLPLRRRVARASSEMRLWVCHHSWFRSRSCWRWLPEL